jgi:hypothetical protein
MVKTNKTTATVRVHFGVSPAEADGYRYFVERRGKLTQGSRPIKVLETKWYKTQGEAGIGLKKAKNRWTRKI